MVNIINEFQAAYVDGRQITDNNYLIDKLVKTAELMNENAYLVSLDARKAFQSVSHEYMLQVMKYFGCGDNIIHIVKTLYTDFMYIVHNVHGTPDKENTEQ